ncbi:MAG TPA: uroporphyrinogen-III synthase [Terriglobales bacterium]|nr:uroporphyrinogen-III synthase [Terriglobales bacterium]
MKAPGKKERKAKKEKKKPLAGQRVLVTRARHQAEALAARLRRLGASVVAVPSIEIRPPRSYQPLDRALRRIDRYDWLILTSVNGVRPFFSRMGKLRLSRRYLRHLHVAAIGPATKAEVERRGLNVHAMPAEYVAEAVVRLLRSRVKGKRVLLVRAKVARDVLPKALRRAGAKVEVVEAYQTVAPPRSRRRLQEVLRDRRPHWVTFTSSSTARNFALLVGAARLRAALKGIRVASIGPVTSKTLRELGLRVNVQARRYTIPGLVQALFSAEKVGQRKRRPG